MLQVCIRSLRAIPLPNARISRHCTEDIAGGLRKALDMDWAASHRYIVHFFDAPPHGIAFHDGDVLDNYPDVRSLRESEPHDGKYVHA